MDFNVFFGTFSSIVNTHQRLLVSTQRFMDQKDCNVFIFYILTEPPRLRFHMGQCKSNKLFVHADSQSAIF